MYRIQETDDERVFPAAIPGQTDTEHVVVAGQVEELLQHPGFQALAHALHLHAESQLNARIFRKADSDIGAYADAIGFQRGLREVVPIARGLIQNGKEVAQRVAEEEETG